MSQTELKKASSLIEDGEFAQARMVIQGILRQDAYNLDAWWMLTQVARDDDEKRQAASRVLKLQANHADARQLINDLDGNMLEETQEVIIPTIAELLSRPKSDFFDDEDEEEDDVFNFDTPIEPQVPRTTPAQAKATAPRRSSKLTIAIAIIAVVVLGFAGLLVAFLNEFQADTPTQIADTFSQTVRVDENGVAEIEIEMQGLLTITVAGMGEFDPVLSVYNHDGVEIAHNDDHLGIQGLESLDAAVEFVPVNGYALIEITEFWDEGGSAVVTVTSSEDLLSNAETIAVGEAKTVFIDSAHWYQLNLETTQEITLIAAVADGDIDPVIDIYDANFNLIANNDDHDSDYSNLNTFDAVIEEVTLSGTVYIRVRGYFDDGQGNITISVK